MSLEQTLELAAGARPGQHLVHFKEAGLPVFLLSLRLLVLERKALGPMEEAVLKAVRAGLSSPEEIYEFLGLSGKALTPVMAQLNANEQIQYAKRVGDIAAKVSLTSIGRLALAEASSVRPVERHVKACWDALTGKLLFVEPEQLYRPKDMRELGLFEVPGGSAKHLQTADIPLEGFDRLLERYRPVYAMKQEVLSILRIERRELRYMECVMLFYRRIASHNDVDVAFWRDDGPALEHEERFRALGGPESVGARLLTGDREELDLEAVVLAPKKMEPLVDTHGRTIVIKRRMSEIDAVEPSAPDTMQSVLCHEHPGLLKKAIQTARQRLLIISPWIRHQVVNHEFLADLKGALERGVQVNIGYGIDDGDAGQRSNAAQSKPAITPQAKKALTQLVEKFKNFKFVYVGNTHRKLLVCDDEFSVITSFNWLSFRGDPKDKPRDEYGQLVRKAHYVDKHFKEGLHLLEKGYSGPQ